MPGALRPTRLKFLLQRSLPLRALGIICSLCAPTYGQASTTANAPTASRPAADSAEEAHDLARTGIAEWRAGNLETARTLLARAFQLHANSELAGLLAELEMKLGHFRAAAGYWKYYLDHAPADRTSAEARLAECRRHLGRLWISVDRAGALVFLDGARLEPGTPEREEWLEPGTHTIRAELGQVRVEQRLLLSAGEARKIALVVGAPQAPRDQRAAPSVPPRPEHDSSSLSASSIVLIVGSSLTAAAAGVGIAYTLKANAAASEVDRLLELVGEKGDPAFAPHGYCLPPPGVRPAECEPLPEAVEDWDRARNVAIGSFVAAGALSLGTAAAFLVFSKRSPRAQAVLEPHAAFVARPHPAGLTLELRGEF